MKKVNIIDFYQMGCWLSYLRLIAAGKPTADIQVLAALESALPSGVAIQTVI